jgi:hypothetical protein
MGIMNQPYLKIHSGLPRDVVLSVHIQVATLSVSDPKTAVCLHPSSHLRGAD